MKYSKKIVLYGLTENYNETVFDLCDRVSHVFQEIMNINIDPYIEDIKRTGRNGYKRPLAIEFISKRMTKYIFDNAREFKNTGLAVGPFMDKKALQQRYELRHKLRIARQNGDHAVIRDNKLYINGKGLECTSSSTDAHLNIETSEIPTDNKTSTRNMELSQTQTLPPPEKTTITAETDHNSKPFRQ